ncbi:MAG: 3,4-dihydroxy-2-butanone-4-phosphate synthase, partial [Sphingomonadaceae bacterium]|nr:3,4-dihydroxy-2-butanone-4-phosphate synthase [Sphingomonadaceae bacterium]
RDLIAFRRRYDHLVEQVAESPLDSAHGGLWKVCTYVSQPTHSEHLVLVKGKIDPGKPTLVRMHPVSPFTDMLGEKSERTGQLQRAMEVIGAEGCGVVVMLVDNSPDRLKQFVIKRAGAQDVIEQRDYGIGAQILTDLGVHDMVLLTNSARTYVGLGGHDLRVVGQRPLG